MVESNGVQSFWVDLMLMFTLKILAVNVHGINLITCASVLCFGKPCIFLKSDFLEVSEN